MKNTHRTLILSVILLVLAGAFLFAGDTQVLRAGKKAIVNLGPGDYMVGDKMLPAGYYQVLCDHSGGGHTLVFLKADAQGGVTRTEAARLPCKMEELSKKAPATSVTSEKLSPGHSKVAEIQIRGENVRHILE